MKLSEYDWAEITLAKKETGLFRFLVLFLRVCICLPEGLLVIFVIKLDYFHAN